MHVVPIATSYSVLCHEGHNVIYTTPVNNVILNTIYTTPVSNVILNIIYTTPISTVVGHMKALFGLKERKWKERKLRKPMDEPGLRVSANSSIDFRDFLSFYFLSTQPNTP